MPDGEHLASRNFRAQGLKLLTGYAGGNFLSHRGWPGGLLLPEEKFKDFPQPAKTLTRACKTGERAVCPVKFGCDRDLIMVWPSGWPFLAVFGRFWPFLAGFGRIWPLIWTVRGKFRRAIGVP